MAKQSKLLDLNIEPLISSYQSRPELYFSERLNITNIDKWEGEQAILQAIPEAILQKKNIIVGSGHALGKDFICGGLVPYFLEVYGPCIVITTAPTDRQVEKIMWGEISGHYNRATLKPPGKILTQEIKIDANWYAIGFTTKETNNAIGKFQGFHSPRVFVIASEAQAIADEVYEQIDTILTGEVGLLIQIGNPTRSTGRFAKDLKNPQDNIVIHLSCLDNPNYIKRKTIVPGLCSYEWVEDKRKRWGVEDPRWMGRILGIVPTISINNIFSESLISHMKSRQGMFLGSLNAGVAIDPAGMGDDDNVFMAGKGGEVLEVYTKTIMPPSEKAHKGVEMCKKVYGSFIIVDCDGLGIETYQELIKFDDSYLQGIQIIKFHGSAPSSVLEGGRPIYANMRAEAAFATQKRAKEGKAGIDYRDPELIEDLMEDTYFPNRKGELQIEPKEDIKERLGRSPGRGDAYKMLQWGFEQGFRPEQAAYQDNNKLPAEYAMSEDGI